MLSYTSDVEYFTYIEPQHLTALGILNIAPGDNSSQIKIPKSCLAVGLYGSTFNRKVPTESPIIFTLEEKFGRPDRSEPAEYDAWDKDHFYNIRQSQLEGHGMKLIMMHL